MNGEISNIVIIGSGNVAWHLIKAFSSKGIGIRQILAHNEKTARNLSRKFSVPYTLNPEELDREAGLYILAVQDDHIRHAASLLSLQDQPLVHMSGFLPLAEISGASSRTGVIWPLQTLTAGIEADYADIPFFIEGNTDEMTGSLAQFAGRISKNVIVANSSTRQQVHLAAVIASNLTNRLYSIAASLLEKSNIPFSVLAPIIKETASKAAAQSPSKSQTGPAARNDRKVLAKHLEMLRNEPEFRDIYRLISENIIQQYSSENEQL